MVLQKTSIFISLILRHKPETIGITLDEHGWADVQALIDGVNASGKYTLDRETLEKDEYALRAKRIEVAASITGLEFYRKMGYDYKNGVDVPDEELLYRLEKHREKEPADQTEGIQKRLGL